MLSRIVRWHKDEGVTYEPDPRHVDIIIRDMGGRLDGFSVHSGFSDRPMKWRVTKRQISLRDRPMARRQRKVPKAQMR